MPAVSLNQLRCALAGSCDDRLTLYSIWLSPPVFACPAVQSFGSHNVCRPNASFLWCSVLSFYRLEQAPNTVIYAMSKIGTATSGLI